MVCIFITIHMFWVPIDEVNFKSIFSWPRRPLKEVALLVAAAIAVFFLFSLAASFFSDQLQSDLSLFYKLVENSPTILVLLIVTLGSPISEELLFRGYLMNRLSLTRLGFVGATFISTTGWTLLHSGYSTLGLVKVFLAGVILSWLLWKTKRLWIPILFHATNNLLFIVYIISTSKFPVI